MQVGQISESLEDYLEVIFRLLQFQKVARVRDIARAKGVKTSSVTSALQRLAKEGLVDYQVREYVDLTENGRELAFRLNQRHTFLKRFLTDVLQVDPEVAERDACAMEHAISVTTLERVSSLSEFLSYCPDVNDDLIPRFRDKWLTHLNGDKACSTELPCRKWVYELAVNKNTEVRELSQLDQGSRGHVARIVADDEMRSPLIQRGVLPGSSIQVIGRDEEGNVDVRLAGEVIRLESRQARSIFVRVNPDGGDSGPASIDGLPEITLADLTPGKRFRVRRLTAGGEIRQRLLDMGFVSGAEGRILREALLRDPVEVELSGYLLSLRRAEAGGIVIEELDG